MKTEESEFDKVWNELRKANDLLRSAYAIANRQGKDTNWEAFIKQVKDALESHHEMGIFPPMIDINDHTKPSNP